MRAFYMGIAVACYAAFFVAFLYLVGFLAGLPMLPRHVDKGIASDAVTATLWNLGLISLFGLQHSVMARKSFKAAWTRIVPPPLERGFYCLAAAVVLALLYSFWHPIPTVIWDIGNPLARNLVWGLFLAGFGIVFISTWLINHFELFGLAQAWQNFQGVTPSTPTMKTPLFYKFVRHPIYTGFLLAFWSAPTMTAGHLLFAVGMTVYIFIGIHHEERDMMDVFGADYAAYRQRVGKVIPGLGKG